MNYIRQMNATMIRIADDHRLNPSHVSMYLALFQFWNLARFKNPVSISREEIMRVSKIGSKATYHKCIKDLDQWNYLKYLPSHNPYKGSQVHMFSFDTSSGTSDEQALNQSVPKEGQVLYQGRSKVGQALVPSINSINNNKLNKHKESKQATRPKIEQVKNFFKKEGCEKRQAEKFFNHYESKGWVVGKDPIVNWRAAAKKWIINSEERKDHEEKQNRAHDQNWDNLNVNNDKRYDHPL